MTATPNQTLLKNPEPVEGPFRPTERDQGPEFIEGRSRLAHHQPSTIPRRLLGRPSVVSRGCGIGGIGIATCFR